MDFWFFLLILGLGFGSLVIARRTAAASLFTLMGALLLMFSGITLFTDNGFQMPVPVTNTTVIENYTYNSTGFDVNACYECLNNVTYLPEDAAVYANQTVYCPNENSTLYTSFSTSPKQVLSMTRETGQILSYENYNGIYVNAFALMLLLIGLAFLLSTFDRDTRSR